MGVVAHENLRANNVAGVDVGDVRVNEELEGTMCDKEYLVKKASLCAAGLDIGVGDEEPVWALSWLVPALPQAFRLIRAGNNEHEAVTRYLVLYATA